MHGLISPITGRIFNSGRVRTCAISTNGGDVLTLSLKKNGDGYRLLSMDNGNTGLGAQRARAGGLPVIDLAWGAGVMVKLVELPRMPDQEIIDTLRHTEQDSTPFPLRDAMVGAHVLEPEAPGGMKVLMAAMRKSEAKKRLDSLRQASFKPISISVAATAIGALLRHSRTLPKTGAALFVHLEDDLTGVHVFKDAKPIFTREIPFGTGQIVNALSAGAGGLLDESEIKAALEIYGVPRNGSWRIDGAILNEAGDLARAPMERLFTEITRSVDYLRRSDSRLEIKNAMLVGSGALIKDMGERLTESCGITFKRYDPFDDFVSCDVDEAHCGPGVALHIGQAIDGGSTLNLFEPGILKRCLTRLNTRPFRLAAAVVILAAAFGYHAVKNANARIENKIAATSAEINTFKARLYLLEDRSRALSSIEKEISALRKELESLPSAPENAVDWRALLNELARFMPEDVALTRITFDNSRASMDSERTTLTLEGLARGEKEKRLENLAELTRRLNGSTFFKFAALRKMSRTEPDKHGGGLSYFEITAKTAG